MSKSAKEITSENFSAAVNSAYALTKKLHSAVLALKIILPLGSILLALHAMILFLGILGTVVYNNPETLIVFRALPFISEYWNSVWGTVSSITELLYLRIIILVAILFLVSFAICSIAMLIIFCFTKAETCVIEGNTAKKAKQLYNYLDRAPRTYFIASKGAPAIWRRICGIIAGLLIIVFMLYYHGAILTQNSDFGAALSVLFQSSKHSEDILNSVGFGFIFYLLYCVLHYVFTLLIQPYCDGYKKWKTTIDAAECYWLSVDSNARKKRQEDATKDSYDGGNIKTWENPCSTRPSLTKITHITWGSPTKPMHRKQKNL